MPALARSRRVIALDLPGFGESAPAGPGFDLDEVAQRITDGLAAEGVRGRFDVVGHSLGAAVALTLAVGRPSTVRRLVLVAPAGLAPVNPIAGAIGSATVERLLWARRRLAPLTDLEWGRRLLLAFAACDPASIPPTQARMMVGASASAQRTAAALAAVTGSDLGARLRELTVPLGVIWGERDRTVPLRHADVIREARPDAEITVIERAGHVVMVERPDAFVAALDELLQRLPKHATTRRRRPTRVP